MNIFLWPLWDITIIHRQDNFPSPFLSPLYLFAFGVFVLFGGSLLLLFGASYLRYEWRPGRRKVTPK
jgi:hypothetical protein